MTLKNMYTEFPENLDCVRFIELLRWSDVPKCPYCLSDNYSEMKLSNRYHCNNCNTAYSVTVNTPFHKTKVDLQKWFYSIHRILNSTETISSRVLAKEINTTKDTAWRIIDQIKRAILDQDELIHKIYDHGKN
jgi:transposase-like protein